MEQGTPRRGRETDPIRALAARLKRVEEALVQATKSANLRNASISGGEGLTVKDANGVVRLRISTDEAAILAYDADGAEVARYGLLLHSDPGEYGIEALSGDTWIHVGDESVSWDNVAGTPAEYPPGGHQHGGGDITSMVGSAAQADGPTPAAFTRELAGVAGSWYAVYMHSNGQFGRATSSIRYKRNVRDFALSAEDLMGLRPVIYDRRAHGGDEYTPAVSADEIGLIAEEVERIHPGLVEYFDGQVDNVRYDRLPVAMLPVVQGLVEETASLRAQLGAQAKLIQDLTRRLDAL